MQSSVPPSAAAENRPAVRRSRPVTSQEWMFSLTPYFLYSYRFRDLVAVAYIYVLAFIVKVPELFCSLQGKCSNIITRGFFKVRYVLTRVGW